MGNYMGSPMGEDHSPMGEDHSSRPRIGMPGSSAGVGGFFGSFFRNAEEDVAAYSELTGMTPEEILSRPGGFLAVPKLRTADQKLAFIERDRIEDFKETFAPLQEELLGDTNSRELVTDAHRGSLLALDQERGMSARNRSRYGLNLSAAQSQMVNRQSNLGIATTRADAVNNATVQQRDRNFGVLTDLMNKGRGLANQTSSTLGNVAGNEAQRDAAHRAAKQQHSAGQRSLLGTALLAAAIIK